MSIRKWQPLYDKCKELDPDDYARISKALMLSMSSDVSGPLRCEVESRIKP